MRNRCYDNYVNEITNNLIPLCLTVKNFSHPLCCLNDNKRKDPASAGSFRLRLREHNESTSSDCPTCSWMGCSVIPRIAKTFHISQELFRRVVLVAVFSFLFRLLVYLNHTRLRFLSWQQT